MNTTPRPTRLQRILFRRKRHEQPFYDENSPVWSNRQVTLAQATLELVSALCGSSADSSAADFAELLYD